MVAVSCRGLEGIVVVRKPINSHIFLKVFDQVHRRGRNYRCLVDGASWHFSKEVKAAVPDHADRIIRNVPYSPQLNGSIEMFFSQ